MKKMFRFVMLVGLLVALSACAPGQSVEISKADSEIQFVTPGANPQAGKAAENGKVAGLATGIWHGLISPVTLVISFFNPVIQMYEVHNNGSLYNLGYLVGVALVFLILGFSGGRRGKR
jgi:hypothetical protein